MNSRIKARIALFVTCTVVTYVAARVQFWAAESLVDQLSDSAARRRRRPRDHEPIDADQTVPRAAESPGEVPL